MAKCNVCGRGPMFGHNDTFSKKKTNRKFELNVTKRAVVVKGQKRRMYVCNNCLKTLTRTA
ncbi:MAG TPA: 50S ribosomal protein L28 [Anaerolineae bacterium]|nr:50S ribosomal protein L28 [Anaerolineae bacterium]